MSDNAKQVRDDETQEITDEALEAVSGGVIEGGCTTPTLPILKTSTTGL